jgi:hypothetical protein
MKILTRDDTEHGVEYVTRADAEREIEAWKANHDNQVELKRIIAARPDLAERAPMVERLVSERNAALKSLAELLAALVRYEGDVDGEAPSEHRRMMDRAAALLPENDEAWHPLPGAPLRFRLRFVATLRLRLRAGSGLPSAGLFCLGFEPRERLNDSPAFFINANRLLNLIRKCAKS